LFDGVDGAAYNIADTHETLQLMEIAKILAEISDRQVVFDLPNEVEKKGFSRAQTAVLATDKIQKLGWKAQYDMENGLKRTVEIMRI